MKFLLPATVVASVSITLSPVSSAEAPSERYEILSDTVKDLKTGLTWSRNNDCTTYSQSDAKNVCQSLGPGWRLPALKELLTLVDTTRADPALDINAFPDSANLYWTASPCLRESNDSIGWAVSFSQGMPAPEGLNYKLSVRCVR